MAGAAFNDSVGNLSLPNILASITDTVSRSNVVTHVTMDNPRQWSGKVITQNIFTTQSSQGEWFNGVRTLGSDIDMATVSLNWYPTGFAQPIALSQVDMALSNTEAGVISVKKASQDFASNSMKSRLGDAMYSTGLGDTFDGLGLIVDDGTSTSTYGGLSRTTYGTYINGQVNAASGGVLDLDFLASLDDDATVSGTNGMTPNLLITTKAVWTLYESLLEPTKKAEYRAYGYSQLNQDGSMSAQGQVLGASGGFQVLEYRGKPMARDEKCPSGKVWALNTEQMEFHSLKLPNLKTIAVNQEVTNGANKGVRPTPFQFRDYVEPYNMPTAQVGYFIVYGNLIHRDPRLNAVGTGVTTV